MDFLTLASTRMSIRKYLDQMIDEKDLNSILEAGRIAPTSGNTQKLKFLIINTPDDRTRLKKAADFYNAPLVIVVCSDHSDEWKRPFDGKSLLDIDASIVTDHMMLEATSLGLGSVWICYFDPYSIIEEFKLPPEYEPVNLLAIGYPTAEQPQNPNHDKRKPISDLLLRKDLLL